MAIMDIANIKKIRKLMLCNSIMMKVSYKKGMFQKMSNWHAKPATTSTKEVSVAKKTPTISQLIQ